MKLYLILKIDFMILLTHNPTYHRRVRMEYFSYVLIMTIVATRGNTIETTYFKSVQSCQEAGKLWTEQAHARRKSIQAFAVCAKVE